MKTNEDCDDVGLNGLVVVVVVVVVVDDVTDYRTRTRKDSCPPWCHSVPIPPRNRDRDGGFRSRTQIAVARR